MRPSPDLDFQQLLGAATRIAPRLTMRLDLDHVTSTLVQSLVGDFGAAHARVWLREAEGGLELRASSGGVDVDDPAMIQRVREVAETGEPYISSETTIFPLVVGSGVRGVLAFVFECPMSASLVVVLRSLATMTAAAIHDVDLFARAQSAVAIAEAAERRQRTLADVSARLGASLEYRKTLGSVAELLVSLVSDGCVIDVIDGDGTLHRVAAAHADPARRPSVMDLLKLPPPPRGAPVYAVLETQGAQISSSIDDAMLVRAARNAEHLAILRGLGPRSGITIPMLARGRVIGLLWLFASRSGRYTLADGPFAMELADRIALAVDNARLFKDAQEAIALRDDFLSIASHELNTPLTSLTLQLDNLRRKEKLEDSARRKLDTAERQVARLTKLVSQLLDVSRITRGRLRLEPEDMDLAPLVGEVIARVNDEAVRVGSVVTLSASPTPGTWDRSRMEQVVVNLVGNAVKYGEGKPVKVSVSSEASVARLVVKDHGIGIAPEHQARIFQRFERAVSSRYYGGFGLGLWIVRQIVETSGGTIRVESVPGEGSTFTVELPREPPAPDSPPSP